MSFLDQINNACNALMVQGFHSYQITDDYYLDTDDESIYMRVHFLDGENDPHLDSFLKNADFNETYRLVTNSIIKHILARLEKVNESEESDVPLVMKEIIAKPRKMDFSDILGGNPNIILGSIDNKGARRDKAVLESLEFQDPDVRKRLGLSIDLHIEGTMKYFKSEVNGRPYYQYKVFDNDGELIDMYGSRLHKLGSLIDKKKVSYSREFSPLAMVWDEPENCTEFQEYCDSYEHAEAQQSTGGNADEPRIDE